MKNLKSSLFITLLSVSVLFASYTAVYAGENHSDKKSGIDAIVSVFTDKRSATKKILNEADEYLNKSLYAAEQDDIQNTNLYYHKFLEKLNSVELEDDTAVFLLSDCESMMRKIRNLYDMDTNKKHLNRDNVSEVSMEYDQEILDKWIKVFSTDKKNVTKEILERSGKYIKMIETIFDEYKLPKDLIYLPMIESQFKNNAVSKVKAVGLWQIMAHRGQALGLQINYWVDERRDPVKATKAAAKYLKELFILLNDWHLALSAYNRGEYGLLRDMKVSNSSSISEMKERNATPRETQNFVPKFIASVQIAKDPEKYGFTDIQYEHPLEFDTVVIDKVIDLKIVAKCADTTEDVIRELNPSLLAWCTPHGYKNFELRIPAGTKDIFVKNISEEKDLNPSPGFIKHKVKKGEWLEKISIMYKTTGKEIIKDNPQLAKQKYLKIGQVLTIRPGKKYYLEQKKQK